MQGLLELPDPPVLPVLTDQQDLLDLPVQQAQLVQTRLFRVLLVPPDRLVLELVELLGPPDLPAQQELTVPTALTELLVLLDLLEISVLPDLWVQQEQDQPEQLGQLV